MREEIEFNIYIYLPKKFPPPKKKKLNRPKKWEF